MSMIASSDLLLGSIPGSHDYDIEEEIGHGTFSEVYRARHKVTHQQVAIKHIIFKNENEIPSYAQREIQALTDLCSSSAAPHIISLIDTYKEPYSISLVLQHCITDLGTILSALKYIDSEKEEDGQSTQKRLLPPGIWKAIAQSIFQALATIHSNNYIHRDVAPYNILFTEDGTVKLADFGLARTIDAQLSDVNHSNQPLSPGVGTQYYRAPELLFGSTNYTTSVDLWSAGCLLAELALGAPLFPGHSDIDSLCRIRDVLGTLDKTKWPGVVQLRDWGKLVFPAQDAKPWKEVCRWDKGTLPPEETEMLVDLIDKIVRYDPATRLTAAQALEHPYFHRKTPPAPPSQVKEEILRLMLEKNENSPPLV